MKERIVELETRVAFQDKTIQELSDIVAEQQQQIEKLTRGFEVMQIELKSLAPRLVAGRSDEMPPPHY